MKKLLLAMLFWGLIFANIVQAAPFQNGDFETGDFTGWSGLLTDPSFVDTTVDPNTDSQHFNLFQSADPAFNWVAKVSNDSNYWQVSLYQDFTLNSLLGPGYTMDITFWIQWSPTDSTQDDITAQLTDIGYTDPIDLLPSSVSDTDLLNGTWVTQDITSFAQTWGGQDVELAFTVTDWDWATPDSFTIDNIYFNQHAPAAPVPEPATVLLLGSGLCGLAFTRKKKRDNK